MSKPVIIAACCYLGVVSLLAIILTVSDKRRAIRHRYRISENALLLTAFFGGSLAEYVTMKIIHHKTLHKKFMWGLPLMLLLQLALLGYLLFRLGLFNFLSPS